MEDEYIYTWREISDKLLTERPALCRKLLPELDWEHSKDASGHYTDQFLAGFYNYIHDAIWNEADFSHTMWIPLDPDEYAVGGISAPEEVVACVSGAFGIYCECLVEFDQEDEYYLNLEMARAACEASLLEFYDKRGDGVIQHRVDGKPSVWEKEV